MTHEADIAFDIEPKLIVRYLENIGWKVEVCKNQIKRLFLVEKNQEQVEIFISERKSHTERTKEVYFALNTISQLYEKAVDSISSDIRSLAFDAIKSKIPSEYVKNDSVELRIASQYIEKMKDFLSSSATTELSGERTYKRARKEAVAYSERCRFGHTFRGSFGFVIESPVGLNQEPTIPIVGEALPLPFERRVIERIARGLSSYSKAVVEQNSSIITDRVDGFSANMCEVLADVIESTEVSKIEMEISLSSEWRSSKLANEDLFYKIERKNSDILRDAASSLRTKEKPYPASIFGRIKRLETEGNPADLLEDQSLREIEVNWLNDENNVVHVKVAVSPREYLDAVEAHKNGNPVSASGMLEHKGRSWRLTEIKNFRVIKL